MGLPDLGNNSGENLSRSEAAANLHAFLKSTDQFGDGQEW